MKHQRWWSLVLGLALVGCIGTDLVEELPTLEPRIDITPVVAAVEQGNTVLFEASVYDGFGMKVPNASVQWESSNASVASVDATGLVSALEVGQTMILAHGEEASSMPALLTVVADPTGVALVVVTPDTLMLPIGTTQAFTAMAFNLNGEPLEGKSFTWNSANPEAASIDADGTARGLEAGTTDITATTDGIVSPPAYLIVPGRSRQGTFIKRAGTSYNVSGTATLQEQANGTVRLTFSSTFSTSSGPGLQVYLSNSSSVGSGSISLGDLRDTTGEQSYTPPSSVTLDTYSYVIIHCVPLNVTFGHARLQ